MVSGIADVNCTEVHVVCQVVGLGGRCVGRSPCFLCGSSAYVLAFLSKIVSAMCSH